MTILNRIVDYIHPETGLQLADIPETIQKTAKLQILANIAAIAYGKKSPYYQKLTAPTKKAGFKTWAVHLSTLSMIYDYDDFMFAGHTGHTSAMLPLLLTKERSISGADVLTSTVIANEVGGRLGASIFLGPHNGQLWTPIHQIMVATILARFDAFGSKNNQGRAKISAAIKSSLAYTSYPLFDTFFSSPAKVFTAASALQMGIENYDRLGFEAPDPFKTESSFYSLFSYVPLLEVWLDLSDRYYSETLSLKKYPGCAYIAGAVEACEKLYHKIQSANIRAEQIQQVKIWGNLLTKKMDDLSRPHMAGKDSSATSLNFSLPINCALMLHDGELTPNSFSANSIGRDSLWELCERTVVRHSPLDTKRMLKHSSLVANPTKVFIENHRRLKPYRKKYGLGRDLLSLPRDLVESFFYRRQNFNTKSNENYFLLNGATVRISTGKKTFTESIALPKGFAGTSLYEMEQVALDKLKAAVNKNDYRRITSLVNDLEELSPTRVKQLADLMCKLA